MTRISPPLLDPRDPSPVRVVNPGGTSPFLLIGDHAGNDVPQHLALGVGEADMLRHIAWDIGVAALGDRLFDLLDATFISQRYSRLVIDCNRDPGAIDAMPEASDGTPVPANLNLAPPARGERVAAIHAPYHQAIAAELAHRDAQGRETVLVALHSFTPKMRGFDRPWQIGILHGGGDATFARAVLTTLITRGDLVVGDNEPYAMAGIDYTIPRHAFPLRRPYVETEIRQDLLASDDQIAGWAAILRDVLTAAQTR